VARSARPAGRINIRITLVGIPTTSQKSIHLTCPGIVSPSTGEMDGMSGDAPDKDPNYSALPNRSDQIRLASAARMPKVVSSPRVVHNSADRARSTVQQGRQPCTDEEHGRCGYKTSAMTKPLLSADRRLAAGALLGPTGFAGSATRFIPSESMR